MCACVWVIEVERGEFFVIIQQCKSVASIPMCLMKIFSTNLFQCGSFFVPGCSQGCHAYIFRPNNLLPNHLRLYVMELKMRIDL